MNGVRAEFKKCKKCRKIYDVNTGINRTMCPYCGYPYGLNHKVKRNFGKRTERKFFL